MLTSDIFGSLRYLPFQEGVLNILIQAKNYFNDENVYLDNSVSEPLPKICFWPKLSHSEPDILIEFGTHLFMLEVKYLSGKSGHFEKNGSEQDTFASASSDQLGREFLDLMDFPGRFQRRSLIYLTSHRTLPVNDIEAGYNALTTMNLNNLSLQYQHNTYWLSWHSAYNSISNLLDKQHDYYRRLILIDIKSLLRRKGFRLFEGFDCQNIETIISQPDRVFYEKSLNTYFHTSFPKASMISGKAFFEGKP